ncbi:MAG: cell division protein SepF [Firmicutes bacterium]|nr:cell division protein SepF [Bacillota bacterium]
MSLWSKFLDFFGFEEEEEEETEDVLENEASPTVEMPTRFRTNVVELQTAKSMKLVVLGPKSLEDVQPIVDHLRARRPVVVNLEGAEQRSRLRILDFLNGAVYALGGRNQRISELIFLLAPHNVDVSNLLEEDMFEQLDRTGKTGGL